jgi:hypothetical protein
VIAEHGTLDPKTSWALNLATAATVGNGYMIGIASRFARMSGWSEAEIAALRQGATSGDTKIDALTRVIREAAANSGSVTDRMESCSRGRLERRPVGGRIRTARADGVHRILPELRADAVGRLSTSTDCGAAVTNPDRPR